MVAEKGAATPAEEGKVVVKTIDANLKGADILPAITKDYAERLHTMPMPAKRESTLLDLMSN